jgi:hypothetical protein
LETKDDARVPESFLLDVEEDQNYFPRNAAWLEEATLSLLNGDMYPIGELSEEDVMTIATLMAAWSKRKSVDAAMTVERLLKRVVDDMQVGNSVAQVTTRFYIYVSLQRVNVHFFAAIERIGLTCFMACFRRRSMHGHALVQRARRKELNKFTMP